jgi:hypothetical protein
MADGREEREEERQRREREEREERARVDDRLDDPVDRDRRDEWEPERGGS